MIKTVLINLLIVFVIILGFEFYFKKSQEPIKDRVSVDYIQTDKQLGHVPRANTEVRVTQIHDKNEVLYDVTYHFDQFGRRRTPTEEENHSRFMIFLGDSNTFGQGLNDDQTYPYFVGQAFPHYKVYNYAFTGYGPNNVMALVDSGRLLQEVKESAGIVIYPFAAYMADRLVGTVQFFGWAHGDYPYYELNESNQLQRNGHFASAYPLLLPIITFFSKLGIVKYFNLHWPDPYKGDAFKKVCASFPYLKNKIAESWSQVKFVVVLKREPSQPKQLIIQCLQDHHIPFVDLESIWNWDESWNLHRFDGHFSEKANRIRAKETASQLIEKGLIDSH